MKKYNIPTKTHTCMYTIHTYTHDVYIYIYIYIYTHTHTHKYPGPECMHMHASKWPQWMWPTYTYINSFIYS
jgi:hypothetical protein